MKLLVYTNRDWYFQDDGKINRVQSVDHLYKDGKKVTLEQLQKDVDEYNCNPNTHSTISIVDLPDDARPVIDFLLGGKNYQMSRYKPGDEVWTMEQNKPVTRRISVVRYFQDRNKDYGENYYLGDDYDHIKQADEVFPDKESLMVKLFEL